MDNGPAVFIILPIFFLVAIPFRALIAWVYNRTGSLFLVGLLHAVSDGTGTGGFDSGLLPRLFDSGEAALFANLAVVQFARECGFTLAQTKQLIRGFSPSTAVSARWRALAESKLTELDVLAAKLQTMRALLQRISRCQCGTLAQCGRSLRRRYAAQAGQAPDS